jgi:DNA-binding CsgD family transcriptional regulator
MNTLSDQLFAKASSAAVSSLLSIATVDAFNETLEKNIYNRLYDMGMTSTQRLIASMLIKGLSNRSIAGTLCISEKTVKFHVTGIYKKFGLNGTHDRTLGFALMKIRQEEFDNLLRKTVKNNYNVLKNAVLEIIRKDNQSSDEYKICLKAWNTVCQSEP